jgi:glycogen operon protein
MVQEALAARPGRANRLGAHWDGAGVNFAVYSEEAQGVDVCLFNEDGYQTHRISMTGKTGHVWHVFVGGIAPGQMYGYRVHGPYEPRNGRIFNSSKLLVDPYARAISGSVNYREPVWAYVRGTLNPDLRDGHDDSRGVPKSLVIDDRFDWQGDRPLEIPWHETVIYEAHVKGISMCHPGVPYELRGTYRGLATEPIISHLKSLGVTAIELLPVHAHADSEMLVRHGLVNYWGYDTLNFFSPEARYCSCGDSGGQVTEFKEMVRTLHQHGIEVILDVVYNHTCEGNHLGPMLSFRGLDNQTYYRLDAKDRLRYVDYTGTGNTLNAQHPQTLKLIMDSLRYWVQEMHVDGFRFDLAVSLARELHEVNKLSPFFDLIHQDPVISQVKLIAEPWDVGEGGYQVGNFPVLWTEWNGRYRDSLRGFWRGDDLQASDLAFRLTGSSDLYDTQGRHPHASINFVTAHDGFTLQDLVSYNSKHNEANFEGDRDGTDQNFSWNCGIEGDTNDARVTALREKQKRNLLATLLISQGVPMLLGGDELGRTQRGNNNAYSQDNEVSWFDWDLDGRRQDFLNFTKRLLDVRRRHPSLRRRHFFEGTPIRGSDFKDVTWLQQDGREMTDEEWNKASVRCFAMLLDGNTHEIDDEGELITDDVLLVLINAAPGAIDFALPPPKHRDEPWRFVFDTARPEKVEDSSSFLGEGAYRLEGRSLVLLRSVNGSD